MRRRSFHLRPAFWWSAFALWFVVLYILSSSATPDLGGPEIPDFDKFLHLAYFSAGGLCMALGLFLRSPQPAFTAPARFVIVLATISLIGVFDEWHQTFTAGRDGASVADWIADTLGGLLAGAAGFFLPARLRDAAAASSR